MRYELTQAPLEEKIFSQVNKSAGRTKAARMELPKTMANAPWVQTGLELYWFAFWNLIADRMSETAPLSWFTIRKYAECNEFDEYQTEAVHFFINEMDAVYVEYKVEQMRRNAGKGQ